MPVTPRLHDLPIDAAYAFGERLERARRAAGYGSQMALARACRLHPMTVHQHEKQGKMPSRATVDLYARVTGYSACWLIYGKDDPLLDLPEVVRDYLTGPHARGIGRVAFDKLSRLSWDQLTDDVLDVAMVHEVRLLVERNLAVSAAHAAPLRDASAPQRRAVQLPLPVPAEARAG